MTELEPATSCVTGMSNICILLISRSLLRCWMPVLDGIIRELLPSCSPSRPHAFLLPWVRVQGLASKILALNARHLPHDWQTRYGHRPLLLETLVDAQRFRGTCYRAANWIYVGRTTGRGRMDREHKAHGQAIKNIYVYPLVRDARQRLCGDPTR